MHIVLYPGDLGTEEPIFWDNILPYQTIPIFRGKKRKMVMDLIAGLELNGPSTTSEIATFLIETHYSKGQIMDMKDIIKRRAHYFWRHLFGLEHKKIGRKKYGKYPSLLKEEYVIIIGSKKSEKNKDTSIFFPSLKGHLVSLGYKFNDDELLSFIRNASRNSLYFAYLNELCNKISLKFVKELFIHPVKRMMVQNRIRFEDDFRLNFDIIAMATAKQIRIIINESEDFARSYAPKLNKHLISFDPSILKELDKLIENTWFDFHVDSSKWGMQLTDLYYPTDEQKRFYDSNYDFADIILIYKVMREVHVAYYAAFQTKIPVKYKQKFPLPIRRNRKKKSDYRLIKPSRNKSDV